MRQKLGITVLNENNITIDATDTSADCSILNKSIDNDPDYRKRPDFVLIIDWTTWESLGPIIRNYERPYDILQPNVWTDTIFDLFQTQIRLPCAFVFKRAKDYPEKQSEYYLRIEGRCKDKECVNLFVGLMDSKPKKNSMVEINVYTRDTSKSTHRIVKRPLRGRKRKEVAEEILKTGVTGWRKEFARKHMKIGETEPPNLYAANVLRQAKKDKLDAD